MKLALHIKVNPAKLTEHAPDSESNNEKKLKAAIINSLPYDFQILTNPVRINKLHFIFEALAKEPGKNIYLPSLDKCLTLLLKEITGIIVKRDTQLTCVSEMKLCTGKRKGIEIEIEELITNYNNLPE